MSRHEVTELLVALQGGDEDAMRRLIPVIYSELRAVAHRRLAAERQGHTLNTTSLVNEVYLKMVDHPPDVSWTGRRHFFAVAARAMRQILVDYARSRNRIKRGGGAPMVTFDDEVVQPNIRPDELVALDEALERLQELNRRQAQVVECRFFAGLSIRDTADALQISVATANRDWTTARLWLKREISLILAT